LKKTIVLLLALLSAWILPSCGKPAPKRFEAEFLLLFDTMTRIIAYAPDASAFQQQSRLIYDGLEEYHKLFDIYNNYDGINNMKTINDNAGKEPIVVDRKIIDFLLLAKEMHQLTDGRVNIALGPVLKIWHDFRETGVEDPEHAQLPSLADLTEAKEHTDISRVLIDEANSTVFLPDPAMRLDVGAIAKGYAVERVGELAKQNGFTAGLISAGGNVRAIGCKQEDTTPWSVGIQNPSGELGQSNLMVVDVCDTSAVTSGIYERRYTVNGKEYHHIIDPDTLFPAETFSAVTVICPDSGLADTLSTALFLMPVKDGKALIADIPDTHALWVLPDGSFQFSEEFEKFVRKNN
jgi:thiamine biosynthesis lipoprotein